MSTLSDILQYKEYQDNVQRDNAASIGRAFDTFNQVRQQGIQNKIADLTLRGNLAQSGIAISPQGNLVRDMSLMNPASLLGQLVQGQSAANTAGNPQAYGTYGNSINALLNGGQQGQVNQAIQQPVQPPSLLDQFVKGSDNAAAVASANAMIHNQNQANAGRATALEDKAIDHSNDMSAAMVSGGSQSTMTGQGTQNYTVPAAKAAESSAGVTGTAQGNAEVGNARDTAQLQMIAQGLKNMNDIHKDLSDKGWAGDMYKAATLDNISKIPSQLQGAIPQDVQKLAGKFTSARNEMLVKIQPVLGQQFGEAGSTRIMDSLVNLAKGEFGDLSTPHSMFEGQTEGTLGTLYRIKLASDKYLTDLKSSGQPLPTNEKDVVAGINSNMSDLTPPQTKQLKQLTDSVLGGNKQNSPPAGASFFSKSTGKYYDAKGKEL